MNDRALAILEQYDLQVNNVRRGRGSYICETNEGLRILSDYNGSENRALFQNCVMKKVRDCGYLNVDLLIPNKEGALLTRDWEENKYVVKEWFVGRECDTSNENEVMAAVRNLAWLHQLMKLEERPDCSEYFVACSPQKELHSRNMEMKKIRSFVRKKNNKCDFERLFLKRFDRFYEQAVQAEEDLKSFGEIENDINTVCHGNYNQHHVLMCGYDIATTNFDDCKFDFQINDLYRFMRKILEKNDWNPRMGMRMLDHYIQIRSISRLERRLLYVHMLFPDKFRKLANHYYGSNKAWISGRFLEKLEKLDQQEEKRLQFVRLLE